MNILFLLNESWYFLQEEKNNNNNNKISFSDVMFGLDIEPMRLKVSCRKPSILFVRMDFSFYIFSLLFFVSIFIYRSLFLWLWNLGSPQSTEDPGPSRFAGVTSIVSGWVWLYCPYTTYHMKTVIQCNNAVRMVLAKCGIINCWQRLLNRKYQAVRLTWYNVEIIYTWAFCYL